MINKPVPVEMLRQIVRDLLALPPGPSRG
jgi:hypothetical protein